MPTLEDLGIPPNPNLQRGGETAGQKRLATFLAERAARYAEGRDQLDAEVTSRLSADLKFGTLSVRAIWRAVHDTHGSNAAEAV